MPKVIFDYSKCLGTGDCVEICPLELLEVSENKRWCKPVDEKVENKEAVEEFHQKVEKKEHGKVDFKIEFDMPECILCMACETACPESAISIEE